MITIISSFIFLVCLAIFLYDFFFQKNPGIVDTNKIEAYNYKTVETKKEYTELQYPIVESQSIPRPTSIRLEMFNISILSWLFLLLFITCIYMFASNKDINLVLNGYCKLEKLAEQGLPDGDNARYFKIFRFFTAGTMNVAFSIISFYIWFMVHRRAFQNRHVNLKFLRQLDYGLFFAGLYVFFLAITHFLQINKHAQNGYKNTDDFILVSFSVLNSIFLIASCIYFGHNFSFFKNTKNKGPKIVLSTLAISAAISLVCYKFTGDSYFSNFDICLSVIALALFSIGVAISFYDKGYRRFLPAFSLFAGLCFILTQISHLHYLHDYIYGNIDFNIEGKPIIAFCNRVIGFTSEIFIGVLFLLIGKTWSTAYENDINRAVVGVYREILNMEENSTIKNLFQKTDFLEKPEQIDAAISFNSTFLKLQKSLESEIARQSSPYMSDADFAKCLIIVENNKVNRKFQNIKQPDQIAVPIDIKKFITSEFEIERKVVRVHSNLLN